MREKSVLVIGLEESTRGRAAEALAAADFFVDVGTTMSESLELLSLLPYDAIIIAFPLEDFPLRGLIDTIRAEGSPCQRATLVVMAEPADLAEAENYVGRGVSSALPRTTAPEQLPQVLASFLDVAPRIAVRAVCRLIPAEQLKLMTLCQTENISASGMLVRTDQKHHHGSVVKFELQLPGQAGPVAGAAEVVRTTATGRDRATGIGVRFVTFEKDGQKRLAGFLDQRAQ